MTRSVIFLLLIFCALEAGATTSKREMTATRTTQRIKIDGNLGKLHGHKHLKQVVYYLFSKMGDPATKPSVVKVIYDNQAIYIGAVLYDAAPDSILREYTNGITLAMAIPIGSGSP
jgi:hypothetical protein